MNDWDGGWGEIAQLYIVLKMETCFSPETAVLDLQLLHPAVNITPNLP